MLIEKQRAMDEQAFLNDLKSKSGVQIYRRNDIDAEFRKTHSDAEYTADKAVLKAALTLKFQSGEYKGQSPAEALANGLDPKVLDAWLHRPGISRYLLNR